MKEEIVKMMVGMSGRYSYHTIFQDWGMSSYRLHRFIWTLMMKKRTHHIKNTLCKVKGAAG
jgi:hypothetical protein|nr:MAG TPA: hypothetical protein [Caudoviricetes sp.]